MSRQLVVHDPASYVQAVKQQLVEKAGIPPLEQRLIFASPRASELGAREQPLPTATLQCVRHEQCTWQVRLPSGCASSLRQVSSSASRQLTHPAICAGHPVP